MRPDGLELDGGAVGVVVNEPAKKLPHGARKSFLAMLAHLCDDLGTTIARFSGINELHREPANYGATATPREYAAPNFGEPSA